MTGKPKTPALSEFLRKARKQQREAMGKELPTVPEWESMIVQAVSAALEYRGFYDYGKFLDDTFLEYIRPVVDQMLISEQDKAIEEYIEAQ